MGSHGFGISPDEEQEGSDKSMGMGSAAFESMYSEKKDEKISAFAYNVGRKLEELMLQRDRDLFTNYYTLEARVLLFRDLLAMHGAEQIDASELLKIYEVTLDITTHPKGKI